MNLHDEIMRIPCDPKRSPCRGVSAELAYKSGHRDARHAAAELAAAAEQPVAQDRITEHAAYQMGAIGAEPTEYERLLFEAWMRGHCWKVCGEWNGKTYVADSEGGGKHVDHGAMLTRQLWAAWRDRAALSANVAAEQPDTVPVPHALQADDRVPDDFRNQASGYRAGWNDCLAALLGKESV